MPRVRFTQLHLVTSGYRLLLTFRWGLACSRILVRMSMPRSERPTFARVISYLSVMLAVSVALGVVVAGLAIPFAGLAGLATKSAADSVDSLPQELEDSSLPQRTTITDGAGNVIATLYDQDRINVQLSDVKRTMVKAIVSIEDYRFYEHGALDLKGTLRALATNQTSDTVQQGGSSITQQLVKLTLVNAAKGKAERKAATEETYARKIKELRYAIALEQQHSKDWILERYLNTAYFGDGAYGIQAAAQHYFGVNASKLDLRQSALLAGLVKSPEGYNPTEYPDRAIERRDIVLNRMAELDVIGQKRADKVKDQNLGLDVQPSPNGCVSSAAPFFCDYVISYLLKDPALGPSRKARSELIKSGGLSIKTTIDLRMEKAAQDSVDAHVFPREQAIGGMAMVEPGTGAVRAIAQSRPMGRDKAQGQTYLNYVTPQEYGDSAGFQAGSNFKVFTLAAAIEQGIPLSTQITAPPQRTFDTAQFANCPGAPAFAGPYPVSNSTSSGTMNLYKGTQDSVNTFFVELERRVGVCKPFRLAKSMGIELTNPTGDANGNGAERVPSFTLGVVNVSPVEMAGAYATFAARGKHCDARPVTSISDAGGNVLKSYDPTCKQVLPEPVADAVNDILRGVQETGFGAQNGLTLSQPSAAKTGTTQDAKAVWFTGYTPNLATSAMIAGANSLGQPQPLTGLTIAGSTLYDVSGSGTAGPMWGDAMKAVTSILPDEDFVAPNATAIAGVATGVPGVGGMSVDQATSLLTSKGFEVVNGGSDYSGYPYGTVAYTSPGAGESAGSGSTVTIYTSAGAAPAPPAPSNNGGGDGGGGDNGNNGGGNGGGGNNGNNGGGNGGGRR